LGDTKIKKLGFYYIAHLIINILLLVFLWDKVNIDLLSLLPIFIIAFMGLQIFVFKSFQQDSGADSAYPIANTASLTENEQSNLYSCITLSFFILLPFEIPFIFFFAYAKFFSAIPYAFAFILGRIIFRIKYEKAVEIRLENEKKELTEQNFKEG